jgi:aspartate/methionine/tyrosine aminotransferase
MYLFSDEMYRHLERPAAAATVHGASQATGHPTLPSAAESYAKGVTLGGLSKAW